MKDDQEHQNNKSNSETLRPQNLKLTDYYEIACEYEKLSC